MDQNFNNNGFDNQTPDSNGWNNQPAQQDYEQQYNQPAQQDYAQQYNQPAQQDYAQQYNQPAQQDYAQQYNQPAQQDYAQQYNQPAQQDYAQQYNQPAQQDYAQQYNDQAYQPNYGQQSDQLFDQVYQSPQYNAPYVQNEANGNGMGVASLVLGIISFVTFCICCISFPLSVTGIILGIVSKAKKSENNGVAIAGIIISAIALVIMIATYIIALTSGEVSSYYKYL